MNSTLSYALSSNSRIPALFAIHSWTITACWLCVSKFSLTPCHDGKLAFTGKMKVIFFAGVPFRPSPCFLDALLQVSCYDWFLTKIYVKPLVNNSRGGRNMRRNFSFWNPQRGQPLIRSLVNRVYAAPFPCVMWIGARCGNSEAILHT